MSLNLLESQGFYNATTLGQGSFGSVYHCTSVNGVEVAVKIATEEKARIVATREACVMSSIPSHPNVLPLVSFTSTTRGTFMALPLATGGDSLKLMHDRECTPLPEADARNLFTQLVDAVAHLHDNGFIHRDIKCENVLLTGERRRTVLLADFGFATRFEHGVKGLCEPWGSLNYSSPEIVDERSYEGPEVDIWSMGVVLYAWATGRLPFGGATEDETATRIITGNYIIPRHVPSGLASLITGMLDIDASKRLTISEIREHPWFAPASVVASASSTSLVLRSTTARPATVTSLVDEHTQQQRRRASAPSVSRPSRLAAVLRRVFNGK